MKIVITQPLGFSEKQIVSLSELGEVTSYDNVCVDTDDWLERVKGANVICSNIAGLNDAWSFLKNTYLTIPFVGYSFMDVEILKKNSVLCSNSPGCNQIAVTEWIIAMLINYCREIPTFIKTRKITKSKPIITNSIYGKSVCILGKGNIGTRVGKALVALGLKVSYFQRGDNLGSKVSNVDILIDCLSYNESTKKFYNKDFFKLVKEGVVFVSVSRTETQDFEAIFKNLETGKIKHYITDNGSAVVFDEVDSTYLSLIENQNITITPHVAAYSDVTISVSTQICFENIRAYISGQPINLIY